MNEILTQIGLDRLQNIPPGSSQLFIDVGLAIDGPNAASWLLHHKDSYVIGIEPSPENVSILRKGRPANVSFPYLCLDQGTIIRNNKVAATIDERFCLLEVAIDDVEEPTTADFYLTDERNTGCSSLLKPTAKLGLNIKEIYQTPVISLKHILDSLIPIRFSHVTFLKTDAQGKDLDVVKSCHKHLKNVLIVQMEVITNGQYEEEQNLEEIEQFMFSNNFTTLGGSFYDRIYLNKELAKTVPVPSIKFIET